MILPLLCVILPLLCENITLIMCDITLKTPCPPVRNYTSWTNGWMRGCLSMYILYVYAFYIIVCIYCIYSMYTLYLYVYMCSRTQTDNVKKLVDAWKTELARDDATVPKKTKIFSKMLKGFFKGKWARCSLKSKSRSPLGSPLDSSTSLLYGANPST